MQKIIVLTVLFLALFATNSFALYVETLNDPTIATKTEFDWDGDYMDVRAGAFTLNFKENIDSDTYHSSYGFCIEAGIRFGSGEASINQITTDGFEKSAWIYENYWVGKNEHAINSGIQLAIWKVLEGNMIDPTPYFDDTTDDDQYDWYETIMADLQSNYPTGFDASNYRIIHFDDKQDMITTNPVPEPATMALFGLGLLGISLVGRKRR